MKTLRQLTLVCLLVLPSMLLLGCGTKDADPNAKVDAPGYYNGPMNGKGDKASTDTGKK